jgi:hypothetical protein
MIKIDQTIIDGKNGDCFRACIASMLELPLKDVIHFSMFGKDWYREFYRYMRYRKYLVKGFERDYNKLSKKCLINGCISAMVPSKNFKGKMHVVLIDERGKVIHDPSPSKQYQDLLIIPLGLFRGFDLIEKE